MNESKEGFELLSGLLNADPKRKSREKKEKQKALL
jgi:hypothetical protein